jgi:hypothetical protein
MLIVDPKSTKKNTSMLVRVEIEYRRRSENTLLKLLCRKGHFGCVWFENKIGKREKHGNQ